MPRTMNHECEGMEKYYTIFYTDEDKMWNLAHEFREVLIEGIKFCPWCGVKLEETT